MKRLMIVLVSLMACTALLAAEPPEYINYQGVLRDLGEKPLTGSFDMVFQFYDVEVDGDPLLTDTHADVVVVGGLFNVHLGGGVLTAGEHATLGGVFAEESVVWLEFEINGETLDTRVRMLSAGYALNASHLDGRDATAFLDTTSTAQTKVGRLIVNSAGTAISGRGELRGGYFEDTNNSGKARIAVVDTGVEGEGDVTGGRFWDSDGTGFAEVGTGDLGIAARGNVAGGHFTDADHSGEAYVGYGHRGIDAYGDTYGGYFADSNGAGFARVGYMDRGIDAEGAVGGQFTQTDGSGFTRIAVNEYGVRALGNTAGGFFDDRDSSGYAYVGYGNKGIHAGGSEWAGYFAGDVMVTEALRVAEVHTGDLTVEVEWADYVFADGYELMPLERLEQYIATNGHLPGIPRAAEVREKGVSIGKSQARLLRKIEELTLHLIAQHERIGALEMELQAARRRDQQEAEARSR